MQRAAKKRALPLRATPTGSRFKMRFASAVTSALTSDAYLGVCVCSQVTRFGRKQCGNVALWQCGKRQVWMGSCMTRAVLANASRFNGFRLFMGKSSLNWAALRGMRICIVSGICDCATLQGISKRISDKAVN